MIAFLFAVDEGGGFGWCGGLPWPMVKADMQRFRKLTMGQTLCVGRETARTLPPLKGRTVLTLTHTPKAENECTADGAVLRFHQTLANGQAEGSPQTALFFGGGAASLRALNGIKTITRSFVSVIHGKHPADVTLCLPDWLLEGGWQEVSCDVLEADGVTFYEYAR